MNCQPLTSVHFRSTFLGFAEMEVQSVSFSALHSGKPSFRSVFDIFEYQMESTRGQYLNQILKESFGIGNNGNNWTGSVPQLVTRRVKGSMSNVPSLIRMARMPRLVPESELSMVKPVSPRLAALSRTISGSHMWLAGTETASTQRSGYAEHSNKITFFILDLKTLYKLTSIPN